ncbi:hypothetical protein M422DRAFT_98456, partial [Sphaerobolus stellatus SS14]
FENIAMETFERIVQNVDEPKDLLSLALTSKYIYKVIVPTHLEFRTIRCDAYREDVWKALVAKPNLTKGIRRL